MENSWGFLVLAGLAALALLCKITISLCRVNRKLPPGPKPWPIIGNLNLLGPIPHQSFDLLSKKYGELMLLKFGSRPVLVASSAEMAKHFLKIHDANFASRPQLAGGKYTSYNYCDMTWAPYGPYWRQARRIYLNEIFTPKRLDSFEYIRVQERRTLISQLNSLAGKPVFLKDHLSRFSLCSMTRMVLSNKYFGESTVRVEDLQHLVDQWFLLNGAFNIGDWIPWLSFLDLQGYVKQMKALKRTFDKFHNIVLDDHRAKKNAENFVPKDMVDVLLQMADDPTLEVKLTNDCVKGLMQDLLTGGTDSLTAAVQWAFQELLRQPRVIDKAMEELDRVVGKERWVEEKDCSQLSYIEAILKETLRLHPLGTMLAPHCAIEDCNVAGYDIEKGTTVLVNVWTIGRDPKYWDRAEEFLPERFLEKDIDMDGHNFAFLPFGSGRRRCPGYSLGLKVIRATLANMLHGFNWKLPEGMKPESISVEEHYGLTTHPKFPVLVIMEPRLSSDLYPPIT
ncbi:hypothetical protein CQW23_10088 [Capsicum baccatum]|uniref:Flavonoid 3'-monooxygenase n=1 Tax=Capsicum baccatum TaxID=33114 RepID=A0A2G2WYS5_CAPBA|nr:hypothetical protein CQW23_10088 [Capsicum baccatum]